MFPGIEIINGIIMALILITINLRMACQLHSLLPWTLISDDSNVIGSIFKLNMHVVLG